MRSKACPFFNSGCFVSVYSNCPGDWHTNVFMDVKLWINSEPIDICEACIVGFCGTRAKQTQLCADPAARLSGEGLAYVIKIISVETGAESANAAFAPLHPEIYTACAYLG